MIAFKKRITLSLCVLLFSQHNAAFAVMMADDKGNPVVQQLIERARGFAKAGRTQEADQNYRNAYRQSQTLKVPEGQQMISILEGLRDLAVKSKNYTLAIEYAQRITQIELNTKGEHHIKVAEAQKKVADLQFESGKFEDARLSYADAIATANGAPSAGYGWGNTTANNPSARAARTSANQVAKRTLITLCYDGMTKCFDKIDDISTVEDLYTSSIEQLGKIKDPEFPKNGLRTIVMNKYHEYLASIQRPDDAIALESELQELSRRQQANRVYDAPKFRPEGAPMPGR